MTRRAAYKGYRNNDQSAETSMDTKTHTGGTFQLEICSRVLFLRVTGAFIFFYHVITTQRTLKMYPLFIRTSCCSFMNWRLFTDAIMDKRQFYLIIRKIINNKVNLFFWTEWFKKSIITFKDLLDENGNVVSFPVFQSKYSLQKPTFLHFYQVICATPGRLLTKEKN